MEQKTRQVRILRYERIINPEEQPYLPSINSYVTREHFSEQFVHITRTFEVLSLEQLTSTAVSTGTSLKSKQISLTFDGGYIEHYTELLHLLLDQKIPAAFCVSPALINNRTPRWPDLLSHLIPRYIFKRLPPRSVETIKNVLALTVQDVNVGANMVASQVLSLVNEVINCIKTLETYDREQLVMNLYAEVKEDNALSLPKFYVSWDDLKELDNHGFAIYPCGMTGEVMTDLSTEDKESEILSAEKLFQKRLPRNYPSPLSNITVGAARPKFFACPDGLHDLELLRLLFKDNYQFVLGLNTANSTTATRRGHADVLPRIGICESLCPNMSSFVKQVLGT